MSFYVRRQDFNNNRVADPDLLMREYYAAEAAGRDIDQNNIAASTIDPTRAVLSSDSSTGLTFSHDSSTLNQVVLTGCQPTTDPNQWSTADDALEFSTVGPFWFFIAARGIWVSGSSAEPTIADFRLLIDGEPGKSVFSAAMHDGGGTDARFGWSVAERKLLQGGDHRVTLQVRDRSDLTATAATAGNVYAYEGGTSGTALALAIGFRP